MELGGWSLESIKSTGCSHCGNPNLIVATSSPSISREERAALLAQLGWLQIALDQWRVAVIHAPSDADARKRVAVAEWECAR